MKNKLLMTLAALFTLAVQAFAQCPIPNGLGVTVVDGTTTLLTWNNMNNATSYKVNIQEGSGNPVTYQLNVTVTTNSYFISGLTEGSNYKFKVRTNCGGNNSNWSDYFNFTSGSGATPTTCDIPTGLSTVSVGSTSANLAWNSMPNATKYKINIQNAQGNNNPFAVNATPGTNSYTVNGLLPGQNYKFKVRTICGQGIKSNFSEYVTFTTAPQKTGVMENTLKVVAYPNPAADFLTVQLGSMPSAAHIQLHDQIGRIVYESIANNETSHLIPVDQFQPGMYILTIQSGDATANTKVMIAR